MYAQKFSLASQTGIYRGLDEQVLRMAFVVHAASAAIVKERIVDLLEYMV